MPSLQDTLRAYAVVVGALATAAAVAWAVSRLGATAPVPPAAAAAIMAGVFWWRAAEGLTAFGAFALLAATIEHWLGLDLLLFDEIAIVLFSVVAVVRHRVPNGRLRIGLAEIGLAVVVIAGAVSSLVEGVPAVTLLAGLALLLKAIAFFYLVSWLRLHPADVARVGVVVLGFGALIGVLGMVEWLNPGAFQAAFGLPAFTESRGGVVVAKSLFLHPAQFGWLTAFTALILYGIFIATRAWWALVLAVVFSAGTVLSGRRTPLVGILAGLVVGLASQVRNAAARHVLTRTWLPLAAALAIGFVLLLPNIQTLFTRTLSEYVPDGAAVRELFADDPNPDVVATLHPRMALYIGSVAIARDRGLLGAGFGRYGSHLSRADYSPIYAEYGLHNVRLLQADRASAVTDTYWPMVLGETGVMGLVGALIFIGTLLVRLWRVTVGSMTVSERAIALGILMVFVEGLVRSLTSSVYTAPPIAYFVLGAAGLSIAMQRTVAEDAEADQPSPTSR